MNYSDQITFRLLFFPALLLAVSLTIFLAACSSSTQKQAEGPKDACGFIEPTDEDVQHILTFGREAFASADWVRSYTVEPYRVSIAHHNDAAGAVAQIDYNIYTCGYTQTDLDNYFSDQNISETFAGYESHTLAHFCEKKNLALYQYDLVFNGAEYSANLWVKQESDTRLFTTRLVFPKSSPALLEEYSQKLFPDLTMCK